MYTQLQRTKVLQFGDPLPEPAAPHGAAPAVPSVPGPRLNKSRGVSQPPEVNFLLFPSRLSFPLLLNFTQHNDFESTIFNFLYRAEINTNFMPPRSRAGL